MIQGHDWVFSNEIEPLASEQSPIEPGELVHVLDRRGRFLAAALYNPHPLIAARVVSRQPLTLIDATWFGERLRAALNLRDRIFPQPYYRWVHGEADFLPGLVVDRFGEYLAVHISTAGMDRLRQPLLAALQTFDFVRGGIVKSDEAFMALERFPVREIEVFGEVPDEVMVCESDLEFAVNLRDGQKTGWYFDQAANRQRMTKYVGGGTMLDMFCYLGAWGIAAARSGATRVVCGDTSAIALQSAQANARRNQVAVEVVQGDAFDVLRQLQDGGSFHTIVLDPPALIKRKKDFDAGLQAYYQLNRLAARLLSPDGVLISCSCSHHLPTDQLIEIVHHAARSSSRRAVITEVGYQSPDHPLHPAIPESGYLKAVFCQFRHEG